LWELLLETDAFAFPDYGSQEMTIIDACPTRDQDRIHRSVRALAERMNISIVEPANTKRDGTCCGDIFFGNMPTEQVIGQMRAKADEMPVDDILVYCVSCSEAMFIGGKRPRYLVDLLFAGTPSLAVDPDLWHKGWTSSFEPQGLRSQIRLTGRVHRPADVSGSAAMLCPTARRRCARTYARIP
jgi:hypothetical protein